MDYKKEQVSKNEVKITYNVSFEDWQAAIDKAYNKIKGQFNVQGFRKGKAPRKKIEALYGAGVFFDDAINFVIPDYYEKTFEEEKDLEAVARPEIDIIAVSDAEFKFSALITTKPDVKLGKYKGLELKKVDAKVSKAEVDEELARAQERAGSWEPAEGRPAKNGDKATIDFSGSVDGVKFDGGTAEGFDLTLGSGQFIPGFEEQVEGMEIGSEKDVKVTFPEDYQAENLAGKEAVFAVKLHAIKEKKVPELNDDFAKDVSEFDTLKAYKDDIKKKLAETKQKNADVEMENALIEAVVGNAETEIPQAMILDRAEDMARDFEYRIMYQGMKIDDYYKYTGSTREQMIDNYKKNAEQNIRTQLVMSKIIDEEKLAEGLEDDKDGRKLTEKLLDFLKSNNKFA